MAKILLIGDTYGHASSLAENLRLNGHHVAGVQGGSAVDCASESRFDLILIDMRAERSLISPMSALTAPLALRRVGIHTPIAVVGTAAQPERVLSPELGIDHWFVGTGGIKEFLARGDAASSVSAPAVPDIFRFADTELDFARYEVRRAGEVVKLTALEYGLLAALARHPGRIVMSKSLHAEVSGFGLGCVYRFLDHSVLNLRRKVEPDPRLPRFIVSVLRSGYRFGLNEMAA